MVRTPAPLSSLLRAAATAACAFAAACWTPAGAADNAAEGPLSAGLAREIQQWARERAETAAGAPGGNPVRVEVEVGQLDPRLRLAPCARIEPYLPGSARPIGRTRLGLRCVDGPTRWNVYLPVQVRLMATAPVLREPLPAGTELSADHLVDGEVDFAEQRQPPLLDSEQMVGRRLTRHLAAGDALRPNDLQRQVWFNAGDTVKVVALGAGFEVSAQGQALGRGLDGQTVRVRTGNGRIVSGTAVAERRVELPL